MSRSEPQRGYPRCGLAKREQREGVTMSADVGDLAPQFSLAGTTGPGLGLAELQGKGRAALFFYPADRTAG
jgi:hypothetical protein